MTAAFQSGLLQGVIFIAQGKKTASQIMSLLKRISTNSFKNKVIKAAKEVPLVYTSIKEDSYNFGKYINHSIADSLTPEEAVLYIIGNELRQAECYETALHYTIYAENLRDRGAGSDKDSTCLNAWLAFVQNWRDAGKIRRDSKEKFEAFIHNAVNRWPQLGEGLRLSKFVFYSVHYDESPAGILTLSPNNGLEISEGVFISEDTQNGISIDFEGKKLPTFTTFKEAKEYIRTHESEPLWWYREDIEPIISAGELPEWTSTLPPEQLAPPTRLEYGYRPFNDSASACCIFAWPKASYEKTKALFSQTGDRYALEPEFRHIRFVNSWTIRKVEFEIPIDNEDKALIKFWKQQ